MAFTRPFSKGGSLLEGADRGIPLLFWGEEVYSTMPPSLLFLRSGGSPYVYLSEVGGGRATSFSRYGEREEDCPFISLFLEG